MTFISVILLKFNHTSTIFENADAQNDWLMYVLFNRRSTFAPIFYRLRCVITCLIQDSWMERTFRQKVSQMTSSIVPSEGQSVRQSGARQTPESFPWFQRQRRPVDSIDKRAAYQAGIRAPRSTFLETKTHAIVIDIRRNPTRALSP